MIPFKDTQLDINKSTTNTLDRLSGASVHPSSPDWNPPDDLTDGYLTPLSSIEQLLRVELTMKPIEQALTEQNITRLVQYMKRYEDENVWAPEVVTDESDASIETPDPWLRNQLKQIKQTEAEQRRTRYNWYDAIKKRITGTETLLDLVGHMEDVSEHVEEVSPSSQFTTRIIHHSDTDRDADNKLNGTNIDLRYYTHIDNCDGIDIRKCGFNLPIPLIVSESSDKRPRETQQKHADTDTYPFVPWCGAATCTCREKHNARHTNGPQIFCDHELDAFESHTETWPPGQITLPNAYTRLFTPQAYNRVNSIPTNNS